MRFQSHFGKQEPRNAIFRFFRLRVLLSYNIYCYGKRHNIKISIFQCSSTFDPQYIAMENGTISKFLFFSFRALSSHNIYCHGKWHDIKISIFQFTSTFQRQYILSWKIVRYQNFNLFVYEYFWAIIYSLLALLGHISIGREISS